MIFFEADARDNYPAARNCQSCCTEVATSIPGESNGWVISYANWMCGIAGGRGLFDAVFSFEKITPDPAPPFPSVLPPTNTDYQFQIEANTSFSGTVSTNAVSPQSTPLTFSLDPINPPSHGGLAMNSNGTFIYVPNAGYTGLDTFGFQTTDGINTPVENIVIFGVDTVIVSHFSGSLPPGVINPSAPEDTAQVYATPVPPNQGLIFVDPTTVKMRGSHLEFPLQCSPETLLNQIYRLTIAVRAMDCNKLVYRHISSYDIRISSCGLP